MDETFIAYLKVRNFFLISMAISLASNNRLFMGHVRYAPVVSLKALSWIYYYSRLSYER